jgi:PAS domain S-box-containing protein
MARVANMTKPPKELALWIQDHLFNAVPMAIAVIDRRFDLIHANDAFESMFGPWQGRKCYQVYKGQDTKCTYCLGAKAFQSGQPAINEEVGYNKEGRLTRYIKHTVPVTVGTGEIPYLIEMCTDITETEQIRREYQLLFDQVPCSVLIIDKTYRIVKTNERARKMLGKLEGMQCYSGLKGLGAKCKECTARQTFADGRLHTGHHVWRTKEGRTMHLHVITVPVRMADGAFDMVMEMAVDVTETLSLQDDLKFAHSFLETIISTSLDGIMAVDAHGRVNICNPAARKFFAIRPDDTLSKLELGGMFPEDFLERVITGPQHVYLPETTIVDAAGCQKPVRLAGHQLRIDERLIGTAFSIQDLSGIKKLEAEKLQAERLAAVGQTVAGLAHGIKNLSAALEGGMYMLSSGIEKGDLERVQKGMTMLDRNIQRISMFVKAFLNFAKGRRIRARWNDPAEIAREVLEMFTPKADELGVQLIFNLPVPISRAPIDYESMHECLTNLVGNAIDACKAGANGDCRVAVQVYEERGIIYYEVVDNGCGMDDEVKKKVFTTFFTTKGLGGTGLGLLMTKKIVQDHGGFIKLETQLEKGTTFRICLPRKRLPKVVDSEVEEKQQ